ncbi:MEKHLA domain-containing protein [Paenibacillus humicola]|uniref:MEKHLA domain-containing protein n=1 Tax=Paenibacillus humicola TaxID=3110540 RepID=UPI00237AE842|nr:MEKHLA domain-containing protein [Paenibacillus humicola]
MRGYRDGYAGVRISRSGRRFEMRDAGVWNLQNEEGRLCGQAAAFTRYRYVQARRLASFYLQNHMVRAGNIVYTKHKSHNQEGGSS